MDGLNYSQVLHSRGVEDHVTHIPHLRKQSLQSYPLVLASHLTLLHQIYVTIELISGFLSHFIAQYREIIGEQSFSSLGHIHIYSRVAQHSDCEKFAFPRLRVSYYNVDTSIED